MSDHLKGDGTYDADWANKIAINTAHPQYGSHPWVMEALHEYHNRLATFQRLERKKHDALVKAIEERANTAQERTDE